MPEPDDMRQARLALGAQLAAWRTAAGMSPDLALTHAHLGQVEQAALHLTAAASRNRTIQSVEKTRLILEARRALVPYQTSPAVTAVDDVLREAAAELRSDRPDTLAKRTSNGR
jgi:hypothetical protein